MFLAVVGKAERKMIVTSTIPEKDAEHPVIGYDVTVSEIPLWKTFRGWREFY